VENTPNQFDAPWRGINKGLIFVVRLRITSNQNIHSKHPHQLFEGNRLIFYYYNPDKYLTIFSQAGELGEPYQPVVVKSRPGINKIFSIDYFFTYLVV
jgi:hypothetical protein